MTNMTMGDIRYNAAQGTYEASVDIASKGHTRRYPCAINGSLTMDADIVRSSLARQALRMFQHDGVLHAIF